MWFLSLWRLCPLNRPPMEAEGSETSIADFESPRSQVMPPSYYGDGSQNIEDPSVSLNQWNVSFYSQLYTSWLNFLGSCQSSTVWYIHCSLLFSVWLCYILLSAWYCMYVPIILQAIRTTASHDPLSGAGEFGVVHKIISVVLIGIFNCVCITCF